MIKFFLAFNLFILISFSFVAHAKVARPPQYVLLAFDGSKSVPFWKESRDFAKNENIQFTYFVSGVYFLATKDKNNYVEPKMGAGKSAINFGGTYADILPRLEQVQLAMDEGHEMASHGNGHYDGATYSQKMWNSEFAQFTDLMANAWKNSGFSTQEPASWRSYFTNEVVGFRAPQLGVGNGLWPALLDNQFLYDTSRVQNMSYWPKKINGIWDFPLSGLIIAGTTKKTLSMDYNFYVGQSKGVEGPATKFQEYEDQMYNTYMGYFKNNYYGNRAPVHIGHHFSKWNGGAYWKAMQRFTQSVCSQPEVECVTYKELLNFVENNETLLSSYQKADFDKLVDTSIVFGNNLSSGMRELSEDELQDLRKSSADHFNTHESE